MNTWVAYWRHDDALHQSVLYAFPKEPLQEPPVLATLADELDTPESRANVVATAEFIHLVNIVVTSY